MGGGSVEFIGVEASAGGLYEFRTPAGVPVRLHDMRFLGADHRTESTSLTLRFVYDDPRWTPPEAASTPIAVFRFTRVQVREWSDDANLLETPLEARGQVSSFERVQQTNVFDLITIDTRLLFSADRLEVTLESPES